MLASVFEQQFLAPLSQPLPDVSASQGSRIVLLSAFQRHAER
ncbi:MAG: hypothetical protein ACUVSV_04715 [Armatimonadota bacterium]